MVGVGLTIFFLPDILRCSLGKKSAALPDLSIALLDESTALPV